MKLAEIIINQYLALDPEMPDKLAVFNGKVIKLEITGAAQALYLLPADGGIRLLTDFAGEADTVLSGSPFSLFRMSLSSDVASLLLKGDVEIRGDTKLGHRFKNILSQMDIDWLSLLDELPMAASLAFKLQQSTRKLGERGKDVILSLSASISEYLQEESRDVVTAAELDIFNEGVDRLREDVDRLQAKIKLMGSKHRSG